MCIAAALWFCFLRRSEARNTDDSTQRPATVHDLCEAAFNGELGYYVRLPLQLPLTPTEDPRIFEYRPGLPSWAFAPVIRIVFKEKPPAIARKCVIVGWVDRIEPDDRPRRSRHLGVVVITSATLAPSP